MTEIEVSNAMIEAGRRALADNGVTLNDMASESLAFRVYAAMTAARLARDGQYVPVRRVHG